MMPNRITTGNWDQQLQNLTFAGRSVRAKIAAMARFAIKEYDTHGNSNKMAQLYSLCKSESLPYYKKLGDWMIACTGTYIRKNPDPASKQTHVFKKDDKASPDADLLKLDYWKYDVDTSRQPNVPTLESVHKYIERAMDKDGVSAEDRKAMVELSALAQRLEEAREPTADAA